jgi:N-hydroxyarylamine O-acetyltransferase
LAPTDGEFDLEARLGGNWASLYRFSLQPQLPVDYEVSNWFTSTHPASLFVNHLIASRATAGRRCALFNNRYTVRSHDGGSERKVLRDAAALHSILDGDFGIALPERDVAAIAAVAETNAAHPSPFDSGQ